MSGTDRSYAHLPYRDRCFVALALRQDGVPIDEIVRLGKWKDKQAAYTAISRAKKPHKYGYKPKGLALRRYAFRGTLVNGKAFSWDDWNEQLEAWVAEGLTRPQMARRLQEMTGRLFTTNQVIGRIHRIRQLKLAKKRGENDGCGSV